MFLIFVPQAQDKVKALDAGADDCLSFLINEPGVGYRLRLEAGRKDASF